MLIDLMFLTGYPLSSDCIEESFELLKSDLHPEETGLKILENSFREQETTLEVTFLTFFIPCITDYFFVRFSACMGLSTRIWWIMCFTDALKMTKQ